MNGDECGSWDCDFDGEACQRNWEEGVRRSIATKAWKQPEVGDVLPDVVRLVREANEAFLSGREDVARILLLVTTWKLRGVEKWKGLQYWQVKRLAEYRASTGSQRPG